MKKILKNCTQFLSSAAIWVFVWWLYLSCGPGITNEAYRFSAFQPNINSGEGLEQFYFTYEYLWKYYSIENYGDSYGYKQNADEWHSYFKKKIPKREIEKFLYETSPQEAYSKIERAETLSDPFYGYLSGHNKEALHYLRFAKKCEALFTSADPWTDYYNYNRHSHEKDVYGLVMVRDEGVHLIQKVTDPALIQRYGYQLEKISFYMKDWAAVRKYYSTYVLPNNQSEIIGQWGEYYNAVAVKNSDGTIAEADYLLSKVFDRSVDKRLPAVKQFSSKPEDVFPYAKNNHEKAVVITMSTLQNSAPALPQLQQVYEFDPQLEYLDILLVREVNKYEDWIMTARHTEFRPGGYYRYDDYNDIAQNHYRTDSSGVRKFQSFLQQVIKDGHRENTDFLNLLLVHLNLLVQDQEKARQHLNTALALNNANPQVSTQIHLTNLLLEIQSAPQTNKTFEKRIAKSLDWLEKNADSVYEHQRIKSSLLLALRNKYIAEGKTAQAALLQNHIKILTGYNWFTGEEDMMNILDDHAPPEQIALLLNMQEKQKKTGFEKYLFSEGHIDRNKLLDLQGTKYLRQGKLAEAEKTFASIPESYWKQYPYPQYLDTNPFRVYLYDSNGEPLPDEKKFTKLSVVQRLIQLQDSVKNYSENKAKNYFLMANAWYNMSYYGNSWIMLKRYWSTADGPAGDDQFNQVYFYNEKALEYYLLAIEFSKDEELTSFCALMAKNCRKYNKRPLGRTNLAAVRKASSNQIVKTYLNNPTRYDKLANECFTYEKYLNEIKY